LYSADILTCRIPDTESLSSYIKRNELAVTGWQSLGACIRRFHDAHIYHADLNAHNILLDNKGNIFLIDFDKGSIDQGESWKQRNLQRLRRSLDKLSRQGDDFSFKDTDWDSLIAGYEDKAIT
jgi:tRNA A-37 threonylcarbamoyl transferase component Bud32